MELPINLDGYIDPADLDRIARDLECVAAYAKAKGQAMRLRVDGQITAALRWERECERVYRLLPAELRW